MIVVLLPLLLGFFLVDSTGYCGEFYIVSEHFEYLKKLILNVLKEQLTISCLLLSCYSKIVESLFNGTLQIAMINKATIKFRSKFQFQILL